MDEGNDDQYQPIIKRMTTTKTMTNDGQAESEEENKVLSSNDEHNRPNKPEEENDKADEEDNNILSPTACRDDEINSNIPNQATTTPENVLSNDEDKGPEDEIEVNKEPEDEIEVNKVPLPTCRPDKA